MPVFTIVGVDKVPLPWSPVMIASESSQIVGRARVAELVHWCIVNPISWTSNLARRCDPNSTSCSVCVILGAEEGPPIHNVTAEVCRVYYHTHLDRRSFVLGRGDVEECREPASDCV